MGQKYRMPKLKQMIKTAPEYQSANLTPERRAELEEIGRKAQEEKATGVRANNNAASKFADAKINAVGDQVSRRHYIYPALF